MFNVILTDLENDMSTDSVVVFFFSSLLSQNSFTHTTFKGLGT